MSLRHIKPTASACVATREILDRVGDKWSLLIVVTLRAGPMRFNELKRQIEGISQRMLTLTLRSLERDGLLIRTMYPTTPARVDYELTPLGRSLITPVAALAEWAEAHMSEIETARRRFDRTSPKPGLMKTLLGVTQE